MPYFERKRFKMEQQERFDIEKAYQRANEVLDMDRIDPEKFEHYDKQMVGRDMQYVRDREAQEILDQLAVFDQYARSHGNPNSIAAVYRQVSHVIERSLKDKEGGEDYKEGAKPLKNDRVLGTITKYLDDVVATIK